uniref:ATP-grasp_2 domain-containing protein n=1 Tax=Angiostrongylus cantonensis TaxID=6313 RepID=A0A158P961_ANGCA
MFVSFICDGNIEYVVKAQILAGGRGKGRFVNGRSGLGGVFITTNRSEALKSVDEMVGKNLVTKQTSKDGVKVRKVMIAEGVPIKRETYVAILMDQKSNGPVVVVSPAGGVDIEEVAAVVNTFITKSLKSKALKKPVNSNIGITGEVLASCEPLGFRVFCIDAKMNFDDSAAFRQKEVFAMEDWSEQVNLMLIKLWRHYRLHEKWKKSFCS